MTPERRTALGRRSLALAAATAGVFYVVWNVVWLASGRLPPSILQWFTGIPVPTTGLTRSLLAALRGDVGASLSWNPFLLPFAILLAATGATLLARWRRRERLVMPVGLARAWFVTLALAWILKLAQGPAWW